ncbi:TauD/TfdA family dioxygenase [Micromonospora maris]|uniref:Clavaminate synthase n=1 Tax=Micromonospora maris TaxID=1003110 RepID=A0A9X0LE50_9ACTN|nr:TauD/TfdA family dioxygenase [Micromonospora maris]AEB47709.1 putative clavaminate synthase-like protein [Micromonospora maris AB-18-032]KUJ46736.1 clavaminate synthase [Micromonospora maris]
MSRALRVARHHLDDRTRDLLDKELTAALCDITLDSDAHEAILARIGAHALQTHLPGEILQALTFYPATGSHVLTIGNLPQQEFPATPRNGFTDETAMAVTNALHFGLLQLLSLTPFAVDYENNGRYIRNVAPNPAAAGTTSSWGADSEFFWHTDNPHLPFGGKGVDPRRYVPRYLSFYAVRNEEQVPTEVLAIEDAVAALDDATVQALQSAQFLVGPPASNDETAPLPDAALLEQSYEGTRARYDRGTVTGTTPAAAAALDRWVQALEQARAEEFVLSPGDFLIFDNYRVLHRRRAFQPGPTETARWLRRCYAS